MANKETKFTKVFVVIAVQCANCKQRIMPKEQTIALNSAGITGVGQSLHEGHKLRNAILCGDPLLAVEYIDALMDNRLLIANNTKTGESNNGNQN